MLVWNGTVNADLAGSDPCLDRHVRLTVTGLDAVGYQAELARVDERHSNIAAQCPEDVDWPDLELWACLQARDELCTRCLPEITPAAGSAHMAFEPPMPGLVRIRLTARRRRQA
jgi:hypothetical protein